MLSGNPDGRRLVEMGTEPPYNGNPWYWRKDGRNNISGASCLFLAS